MNRLVSATELKAKCLALLDDVNERGDIVTITKRGRPVAILQPVKKKRAKSLEGAWVGKVEIVGDLDSLSFADEWEAFREPLPRHKSKKSA